MRPSFAAPPAVASSTSLSLACPASLVVDASGRRAGVTLELGQALAERLQVPSEVVEFRLPAEVVAGMKAGAVDVTFTNATAARAKDVDFTKPLLALELGFLVPRGSAIADIVAVDRSGIRIGVSQGSSSQAALPARIREAKLVAAPSLDVARAMLERGELDAFATNKGILFQMADQLPGSRVLDGRWGEEHVAIAIPQGRDAGREFMTRFAADAVHSGRPARRRRAGGALKFLRVIPLKEQPVLHFVSFRLAVLAAVRGCAVALACASTLAALPAAAQPYPSKPIKVYVGYAAGGAVDIVARSVGQAITAGLGQPVVVENKPGAGSNIAIKATIDSPPDGYTLLLAANALAANMALYQPPKIKPD